MYIWIGRERRSALQGSHRRDPQTLAFTTSSSERLASSSVYTEKENPLFSAEGRNFKHFLRWFEPEEQIDEFGEGFDML